MSMKEKFKELIDMIEKYNDLVMAEYDSWENFLKDIGVYSTNRTIYSNQEVIDSLKKFYDEFDGDISLYKYEELKRKPSSTVIYDRFGTWENALKIAGVYNGKNTFRKETIIITDTLREAKSQLKENFNSKTYYKWAKENEKVSVTTIQRRFGSWNDALKRAGIDE